MFEKSIVRQIVITAVLVIILIFVALLVVR